MPKVAITDRGYRGLKEAQGVKVLIPSKGKKNQTKYQKQKARKQFRKRAGIEPVIGHIKNDHRMIRNYLKGIIGDIVNAIASLMGFNLKKKLNQIAFLAQIKIVLQNIINQNLNYSQLKYL